MYKKIIFIILFAVFALGCNNNTTSPNSGNIGKYAGDWNMEIIINIPPLYNNSTIHLSAKINNDSTITLMPDTNPDNYDLKYLGNESYTFNLPFNAVYKSHLSLILKFKDNNSADITGSLFMPHLDTGEMTCVEDSVTGTMNKN